MTERFRPDQARGRVVPFELDLFLGVLRTIHDRADPCSSLVLHVRDYVAVDVERDHHRAVTQTLLDNLGVHVRLQQERGVRVPKVVQTDPLQLGALRGRLELVGDYVGVMRIAVRSAEHQVVVQELRPVAKYIGVVSMTPPNGPASQPTVYVLREFSVASLSLRTPPDLKNPCSLRFPLKVWASSLAEAIDGFLKATREALQVVLDGKKLRPDAVLLEVDPDSVHGPRLG